MNDKVLQAVIKLRDEISKPLKSVKQNMENLNKAELKELLENEFGQILKVRTPCQD